MFRRSLRVLSAVVLLAGIAMTPACKRKNTDGGGTPAVKSDYVVFAHLKTKDILESQLFTDVKKTLAKQGGNVWETVEQEIAKEIGGLKPSNIDSVTAVLTDVGDNGMPKMVVIVAANKAIDKAGFAKLGPLTKPDSRGFYPISQALLHFPDDKTLVIVHPDLAQQYLDGYAKDRAGWPMTAELKEAASGHTLYAVVDLTKLPNKMLGGPEAQQVAPLLKAQRVVATADLKGKEFSATVRATFPNAADAGNAKETVQNFVGMATAFIDQAAAGKGPNSAAGFEPLVKELQRALKGITIEVSGADLTVAGNLKIEFDLAAMLVSATQKVREAAARMQESNNLKQIGLAFHNYHSSFNNVPIHATGANGRLLANAKDKPLLSWRVAMLPYIEQDNLYKQFKQDEPWDSEHNKKLIPMMPKVYAPVGKMGAPGYTHLQMVIGPNAMQPPSASFTASFPDGLSQTVAVIQATEPVIWTKPDDVMLPGNELPKDLKKKFGGQFPGGFNVLMWDGSVLFISNSVSDLTLGRALNPRDGQPLGSDWRLP